MKVNNVYKHHVFFCTNQRPDPESSCGMHGSGALQAYAKQRVKDLGMHGAGDVRINKAGCLGRCDDGPCLVVYPAGVWYGYVDESDVDEIIDVHLKGGRIVDRLRLPE